MRVMIIFKILAHFKDSFKNFFTIIYSIVQNLMMKIISSLLLSFFNKNTDTNKTLGYQICSLHIT